MKLNCLWTSQRCSNPSIPKDPNSSNPSRLWFWRAEWISFMDGSVWHHVTEKKRKSFFLKGMKVNIFWKGKVQTCWRMLDHLPQFTKLEGLHHLQKLVFSSKWQISKTTMIQIQNSFSTYTIYIIYKNSCPKTKCMVSYVYVPTNLNQIYGNFHLPSWHECLGRFFASPFRLAGAIIGKASKTVHTSTVNPCRFFHRERSPAILLGFPPPGPAFFYKTLHFSHSWCKNRI